MNVGIQLAHADGGHAGLRGKEQKMRGRRRPDPFVPITTDLRPLFEAEPRRKSRESFERWHADEPQGLSRSLASDGAAVA